MRIVSLVSPLAALIVLTGTPYWRLSFQRLSPVATVWLRAGPEEVDVGVGAGAGAGVLCW